MTCQRCRWGTCASLDDYDNHIRADERAKIVAWIRAEEWTYEDAPLARSIANIIERGEHRPNPGQPKEGEHE